MLAKRIVPLIVAVALFMENMDSTVIATSLPAIAADIGTSPLTLKLAITSYLLSLAVFIPASGWTADRFGARMVFAIAVVGCTREKPPVTVPMPEANVAPVTATLATVSPYTPMATLDALGTPVVSTNPTLSATLPSETAATSNPAVTLLPTTPGAATTYTVQWGD